MKKLKTLLIVLSIVITSYSKASAQYIHTTENFSIPLPNGSITYVLIMNNGWYFDAGSMFNVIVGDVVSGLSSGMPTLVWPNNTSDLINYSHSEYLNNSELNEVQYGYVNRIGSIWHDDITVKYHIVTNYAPTLTTYTVTVSIILPSYSDFLNAWIPQGLSKTTLSKQ